MQDAALYMLYKYHKVMTVLICHTPFISCHTCIRLAKVQNGLKWDTGVKTVLLTCVLKKRDRKRNKNEK